MKFSKQKPTKEGFYIHSETIKVSLFETCICAVRKSDSGQWNVFIAHTDGYIHLDDISGYWSNRLPLRLKITEEI